MDPTRRRFLVLLAVGGCAVLASYVHGLASHPETRQALWGGVPAGLRPLYTVSMLTAAAGWFAFTSYLVLQVPSRAARVGRFGYGLFVALQAVILVGSALWLPLTFALLDAPEPSHGLWWLIRIDLLAVGAASLALIPALVALRPRPAPAWRRVAVAGAVAFTLQTLVLDALVWPAYFPL